MDITSSRAKAIQSWIKEHPTLKSQYEKAQVQLNGSDEYLEVWNIPIEFLIYNIRNGRFAAELLAEEKKLKRILNPTITQDAKIIQRLLLEQKPSETEALKANLREHGQTQYGIITFDGAVINANRRMAVLSTLYEETRNTKFQNLRVALLPKNVSQQDLWRIEAGIQFGKDFILDYPPVNELLKIREGIEQGLTAEDIVATLLGHYNKKEIEEKLEILKQIESYLDFIGKPKQYDEVKGDVEKFNSLHKNVISSLKKQGVSEAERYKINLIAFSLIKSKNEAIRHWEIRKLKDIVQVDEAKNELMSKYDFENPEKTNLNELVESFSTAEEILKNRDSQDKPKQLLKKALDAISVIDSKSPKLKDQEINILIEKIEKELKRLRNRKK